MCLTKTFSVFAKQHLVHNFLLGIISGVSSKADQLSMQVGYVYGKVISLKSLQSRFWHRVKALTQTWVKMWRCLPVKVHCSSCLCTHMYPHTHAHQRQRETETETELCLLYLWQLSAVVLSNTKFRKPISVAASPTVNFHLQRMPIRTLPKMLVLPHQCVFQSLDEKNVLYF